MEWEESRGIASSERFRHCDENVKQTLIDQWKQHLVNWFPELNQKTYFVPPIHINTVKLQRLPFVRSLSRESDDNSHKRDAQNDMFEMEQTTLSDSRNDRAHLQVMHSLWNLSKLRHPEEVMVVLSRYQVGNYMTKTLQGISRPRRKSKKSKHEMNPSEYFPVPREDGIKSIRRGDFDVLIIHKQYGFIVLEIKAIGDQEVFSESFPDKIKKGLWQLDRLYKTLQFIISDLNNAQIPITKVLALPNLTREVFSQAMLTIINGQLDLQQELPNNLSVASLDGVLTNSLCKDELAELSNDNDAMIIKWWEGILCYIGSQNPLDVHTYQELIARFCGPVSTVEVWSPWHRKDSVPCEVRTISEATHEMEMRYTMRILRRQQLDLLQLDNRFVYLTGPPRSGKTLVLLLKAMEWVENGDTLIVVRTTGNNPGHFISHVLYNQIVHTLKYRKLRTDKVHLETINAHTDAEKFVDGLHLKYQVPVPKLRLLIDELWVVDLSAKLKPLEDIINTTLDEAVTIIRTIVTGLSTDSKKSLKNIQDDIKDTLDTLKYILSANRTARKLLKDNVKDFLDKMKIKLDSLHVATSELQYTTSVESEENNILEKLERVKEITDNTRFYARVIASWIVSPILMEITQIVSEDKAGIKLWCTGFWPRMRPKNYYQFAFEYSIGCPPHVQRIMEKTEKLASYCDEILYKYVTDSTTINPPLPAEGEFYHLLNHSLHWKQKYRVTEVYECASCGNELADVLINMLRIKEDGLLKFRDVIIVGRALLPLKPNCLFLQTLSNRGIRIRIMVYGTDDLGDDINVNDVIVSNTFHGHGLERAIVIFVPVISRCDFEEDHGRMEDSTVEQLPVAAADIAYNKQSSAYSRSDTLQVDKEKWMRTLGDYNRRGLWFVASRCAAELIIFHV